VSGWLFDIQRFCIHDGPGIRTTVFLKGCPLRCPWCHNPESWLMSPQVLFYEARCIGCGTCKRVCPVEGAIVPGPGERINRALCTGCGLCAEACPAEALVLCGKQMSVAQVMAEVQKDRPFYESSGGGMTVSGGEPLMQPEFTVSLLAAGKAAGLHCALDTCGHGEPAALEEAAASCDLVLYDLKLLDPQEHAKVIGVDNALILQNLRLVCESGVPVVIRVPVIPGFTDSAEHVRAAAALAASLPHVEGVELMRYNPLGEPKWRRLGMKYPLEGAAPPDQQFMARLKGLVESEGLRATVRG